MPEPDGNELIKRAALHEVGHSFVAWLLSGEPGSIEVKWLAPGTGNCSSQAPNHWDDDELRFYLYSGLVSAGGYAAERVFDPYAAKADSLPDFERVEACARELIALAGVGAETVSLAFQRDWLHDFAYYLLAPHAKALKDLADYASSRQHWGGSSIACTIYMWYPAYRGREPLFEGDWFGNLNAVLDTFFAAEEARWSERKALRQRIEQRIARYEATRGGAQPTGTVWTPKREV